MRIVFSVIAFFEIRGINHPVLVHREIGDGKSFFFQVLAGMKNGMVFDCGSDDVIALFPVGKCHSLDCPVVGFAAA